MPAGRLPAALAELVPAGPAGLLSAGLPSPGLVAWGGPLGDGGLPDCWAADDGCGAPGFAAADCGVPLVGGEPLAEAGEPLAGGGLAADLSGPVAGWLPADLPVSGGRDSPGRCVPLDGLLGRPCDIDAALPNNGRRSCAIRPENYVMVRQHRTRGRPDPRITTVSTLLQKGYHLHCRASRRSISRATSGASATRSARHGKARSGSATASLEATARSEQSRSSTAARSI